jgi:hypothetical protein
MLKWILKQQDARVWTGFIWINIWIMKYIVPHRQQISCSLSLPAITGSQCTSHLLTQYCDSVVMHFTSIERVLQFCGYALHIYWNSTTVLWLCTSHLTRHWPSDRYSWTAGCSYIRRDWVDIFVNKTGWDYVFVELRSLTGLLSIPQRIHKWISVEIYWQGKNKGPVPLCPSPIPHCLPCKRTRSFAVRRRRQPPELWHGLFRYTAVQVHVWRCGLLAICSTMDWLSSYNLASGIWSESEDVAPPDM